MTPIVKTRNRVVLSVVSGLALGLAFPPLPLGVLAAIGFVPFFAAMESVQSKGQAFRLTYFTFFILNCVTIYWTGGYFNGGDLYMMVAGALLIIVHPLFFSLPVIAWRTVHRRLGAMYGLLAFPFIWTGFEYLHAVGEIGFPWLTIGNTQSYDLQAIQMASVTGVYGISFWLCWLNVLAMMVYKKVSRDGWHSLLGRGMLLPAAMLAVYLAPKIYGAVVLSKAAEPAAPGITCAVIQPNIDPFEKWEGSSQRQFDLLQSMTDSVGERGADLVIWPETAVPFYLLHPNNRYFFEKLRKQVDRLDVPLLTGIPDIIYTRNGEEPASTSKHLPDGTTYETFNSSLLLTPNSGTLQRYAKIVLVPFAERVPYASLLSGLNAMKWNFGLGGWAIGRDTAVFSFRTRAGNNVKFSNTICYESAYPGFVAAFVRKGAEFLTVITNDSWWGNTSGTYQHRQIAVLRAVENRRWIVQCANGGISCAVNPWGRITESTPMFIVKRMSCTVGTSDALTFYTSHGDWLPEFSLIIAFFTLAAAISQRFYSTVRLSQYADDDLSQ
jgi:apolipoprotein N-acyltransferase